MLIHNKFVNKFKVMPLLGFVLLFLIYCKKKQTPVVSDDPYPELSAQREAIAKKQVTSSVRILDSVQLINSLAFLSSAECEGRKPGTPGHEKALEFIKAAFRANAIDSLQNAYLHTFEGQRINNTSIGRNLIGIVRGTSSPEQFIVVSAHYDHVGISGNGEIFYGADDNASGAALLPVLAKYFKANPIPYSIIFAALDREETGLEGAKALVKEWQQSGFLAKVFFNLNLDMIARSDKNEIFACGIFQNPTYKYVIDSVQNKTKVGLLMGHDGGDKLDNWTNQSDHHAFHQAGIPFIYMGVEDHPDYHRPSDTFDKVDKTKYLENSNLIASIIKYIKPK